MHRIKNITPCQAASAMIGTIAPFRGSVLDTATGLGYTAIEAAKTAGEVITIELDPMALEMAGFNPWSRSLFTNQKIIQVMGNSLEKIGEFPGERFSSIIHDPPSVSLAGELYSGEFYKQTYRVLKPHGRMFHYIGDPTSAIGARTTKGVQKRLRDAGFRSVALKPSAYGVLAEK
jgi:predicted methyltransferase